MEIFRKTVDHEFRDSIKANCDENVSNIIMKVNFGI